MHARKAVKLLNVKFRTIYVLEVQVSILCLCGLLFLKVFLSFNTILCATSEPGFLIKTAWHHVWYIDSRRNWIWEPVQSARANTRNEARISIVNWTIKNYPVQIFTCATFVGKYKSKITCNTSCRQKIQEPCERITKIPTPFSQTNHTGKETDHVLLNIKENFIKAN